jgi:hypothetical protein
MELELSSTLLTLSDLSMYRLRKFSAPPFSDLDIWVENFLENAQKFYDIGAWSFLDFSFDTFKDYDTAIFWVL